MAAASNDGERIAALEEAVKELKQENSELFKLNRAHTKALARNEANNEHLGKRLDECLERLGEVTEALGKIVGFAERTKGGVWTGLKMIGYFGAILTLIVTLLINAPKLVETYDMLMGTANDLGK